MKQQRNRRRRGSRSASALAVSLAFAALALIVPGVANAGSAAQTVCPGAVTLSGGTDPTADITVDDDLELLLNGDSFFLDDNGFVNDHPPIGFEAKFGDQLRVIATNGDFGGPEHIDPLYLTCDANDAQQVLDDTGFDAGDSPAFQIFYDETFTIQFGPPETTITKSPKKKTQKRKAKFRFAANPAAGAEFECKLDKKAFKACGSPYKKKVRPGRHKLKVVATVDGVSDPTPAKFKWKVRED
jgi:hypothetical protein